MFYETQHQDKHKNLDMTQKEEMRRHYIYCEPVEKDYCWNWIQKAANKESYDF